MQSCNTFYIAYHKSSSEPSTPLISRQMYTLKFISTYNTKAILGKFVGAFRAFSSVQIMALELYNYFVWIVYCIYLHKTVF